MKIFLTNDDGYHATGLNFLNNSLGKHETLLIAPDKERSGCGHGITLGEPLRLTKKADNVYSCSGLPADCVLVGIGHMMKDNKPDIVISGINHGANLGQDRFYSGTISAAREAAFRGIPSIATSLVINKPKDVLHFETCTHFINYLVDNNVQNIIPEYTTLNINFPNLPLNKINGVKYSTEGFQIYSEEVVAREDTRGKLYFWVGGTYQGPKNIPNSDATNVSEGFIACELQKHCDLGADISASVIKLKEMLSHYVWEDR